MNPLANYIWLIKLLQKSPNGMTFKEINEKYLEARRNTKDKNIPYLKRTFHNHINCISREYGIHIVCGPGYRYYIDDPFNDVASKVERLSIFKMMSETVSANRCLFVDDNFHIFRDNAMVSILDAIKAKHKVILDSRPLAIPEPKYQVLKVAPYQLHYMYLNWYLIGQDDNFGLMRIPLNLYLREVQITNNSYKFPHDYSPEKYGKMIYGTNNERIKISVKINDLYPERLHLDKYPLMPFYQEIKGYDYIEEGGKITMASLGNSVRLNICIPNNPFALYMLQSRLSHYRYTILNDINPFTLYTDQQYQDAVFFL